MELPSSLPATVLAKLVGEDLLLSKIYTSKIKHVLVLSLYLRKLYNFV